MTVGQPEGASLNQSSHLRRACRAVERPPAHWPPATGLADHRLVFLAAKPALDVLAQSRLATLLSVFERSAFEATPGSAYHGKGAKDMTKERRSASMQTLVLACDDVAGRLSPDEVAAVRASGQLPSWFVPAVYAQAREIRRHS